MQSTVCRGPESSLPSMTRIVHQVRREHALSDIVGWRIARHLAQRAAAFNAERGHRMAIFANDLIGIGINQFGLYERHELELLFSFLQPLRDVFADGLALDIGANIGNHSLYFARRFRRVHAFEPNPSTVDLLRFNSRWVDNVTVHPIGLGDEAGECELFEDTENLGGSTIAWGDGTSRRGIRVAVRRLDELDLDVDRLCFVKIDVEGFEARVLQGGAETLARAQPVVVFEQHLREFAGGSTPSIDLLTAWGYRMCWQHAPRAGGHWLARRWRNVGEILAGRRLSIVTGDRVPCMHHSMLIAVPHRFQSALGLR